VIAAPGPFCLLLREELSSSGHPVYDATVLGFLPPPEIYLPEEKGPSTTTFLRCDKGSWSFTGIERRRLRFPSRRRTGLNHAKMIERGGVFPPRYKIPPWKKARIKRVSLFRAIPLPPLQSGGISLDRPVFSFPSRRSLRSSPFFK